MISKKFIIISILLLVVLSFKVLGVEEEISIAECNAFDASLCTGPCEGVGGANNYWCTGPGTKSCDPQPDWWCDCCCLDKNKCLSKNPDMVMAQIEDRCSRCGTGEEGEDGEAETVIDSITRCYPEEKNITINYTEVYAEINSIKVNDEEQLLEDEVFSTKGTLSNDEEFYKHFATKSFSCAPKQNEDGTQDEYCYVDITVSAPNDNVKLLVLDSDFASTPCAITKEFEEKEECLSPELVETNFKDNVVRVLNNEEKTIDVACDQDIMIKPFLKTSSQRWTEVCENPAVALIQEYKTGTQEEDIRTIFDWQRVDVDEWEDAYLLNRAECELQIKESSVVPAYRDTELDWEMVRYRENCEYLPNEDKCYWINAKAGTTLKIKLADATEDSFIELGYRNCDCYCNEEEGIPCAYEADTCNPEPLRDLECPDILSFECDKTGDWPYTPDGLPSCGGRGGGYSGSEDVDYSDWIDLGIPYDVPICLGPGPTPNYCARRCPVERDREKESNCFGDDVVKRYYWGACVAEASCYPGYISLTGQECAQGNCVFGCVWDNECLDCTGRPETECYDGLIEHHVWTGEPDCECICEPDCEPGETPSMEPCGCISPPEEPETPPEE